MFSEVTHALFLFSSLFAFSRATFFNGHDSVMLGKHNFEHSEANSACIYVSPRSVKSSPFCIKIL